MQKVIRMSAQQEHLSKSEYLDGPRVDPAKIRAAAGDVSAKTRIQVSLLGHVGDDDEYAVRLQTPSPDAAAKPKKKAQGFILDVSRKSPAACQPPTESMNPLRPTDEKFVRQVKRNGFSNQESSWTWGVGDFGNNAIKYDYDAIAKSAKLHGSGNKLTHSVKGERKYCVCGIEDMLPPATEKFMKSDRPPAARYLYENDKRDLQAFEMGRPAKCAAGPEYGHQSPEMWICMAGVQRPLEKWQTMTARNVRERERMNRDEARRLLNETSTIGETTSGSFMRDRMDTDDARRLLDRSPTVSEYSASPKAGLTNGGGSRTSRSSKVSVTSSQMDLTQPRWR
jgi:hypothetical protein